MRDEPAQAPARRGRAVVSVTPTRNGCADIRLECGHVFRRRLAFCAPSRLPCPICARAERDAAVEARRAAADPA